MEPIFPTDKFMMIDNRTAKLNWLKRIEESQFIKAGITFTDSDGSEIWILALMDGNLIPLFEWGTLTDKEIVKVIETVREMRQNEQ